MKLSISRHILRQVVRTRRRSLSFEQRARFSQQAADRIIKYPPVMKACTVAVFLPFDGEIDTNPLIKQLWRAKKRVYLPVINDSSVEKLLFLLYQPQTKLVINRLKIQEPLLVDMHDALPLNKLDVLIAPLVAFDKQGQRLGMGGGFYDRILHNWQQYGFQLIGYAYDCQLIEALPVETWDVSLPLVITPKKLWIW